MAIRMCTRWLVTMFAACLAGCADSGSPTRPTAGQPVATVNSSELIKGTVSDSAFRPIAGARVELLDGPQAGASTTTNAAGEFVLSGTVDDTSRFRASKTGHVAADATIVPDCDRCMPRRWVHFYLGVLDAPVAISGDYTVTFTAGSACTTLPDELRTRSYEATIGPADLSGSGLPANTSFKVTPKGSAFPDALNHFMLNVAGGFVAVSLGDHGDVGLTERLALDTYFAVSGWGTVSVEAPVSTISTTFQGWIDYCVNPQMGERYDCTPAPTVTVARCDSARHQLLLTRH